MACPFTTRVGEDHTAAPEGPKYGSPCEFLRVGLGSSVMVEAFQTCCPVEISKAMMLPRKVQQGYAGSADAPSSPDEIGTYTRLPWRSGDPVMRAEGCGSG